MKQKDYKYTDRDVLIAKKAIEELDRLSTYYLTESIKVLEPIINNILTKINFEVKFEITETGKFAIRLQKEDIVYTPNYTQEEYDKVSAAMEANNISPESFSKEAELVISRIQYRPSFAPSALVQNLNL